MRFDHFIPIRINSTIYSSCESITTSLKFPLNISFINLMGCFKITCLDYVGFYSCQAPMSLIQLRKGHLPYCTPPRLFLRSLVWTMWDFIHITCLFPCSNCERNPPSMHAHHSCSNWEKDIYHITHHRWFFFFF